MHVVLRKAFAFSLELVFAFVIVVTGGPVLPKVFAPAMEPGHVASPPNQQSIDQSTADLKNKGLASRSASGSVKAITRVSRRSREMQFIRSPACKQDSREYGFGGE